MNFDYHLQLNEALIGGDSLLVEDILEKADSQGVLTQKDRILWGITAMFPPNADPYWSLEILEKAYLLNKGLHEAVWLCYLYLHMPVGEPHFQQTLEAWPEDSVALHMLAEILDNHDRVDEALTANERSLSLKLFPKNILFKLRNNPPTLQRDYDQLVETLDKEMLSKACECDPNPANSSQEYEAFWNELILGIRMTTSNWEFVMEDLAKTRAWRYP